MCRKPHTLEGFASTGGGARSQVADLFSRTLIIRAQPCKMLSGGLGGKLVKATKPMSKAQLWNEMFRSIECLLSVCSDVGSWSSEVNRTFGHYTWQKGCFSEGKGSNKKLSPTLAASTGNKHPAAATVWSWLSFLEEDPQDPQLVRGQWFVGRGKMTWLAHQEKSFGNLELGKSLNKWINKVAITERGLVVLVACLRKSRT